MALATVQATYQTFDVSRLDLPTIQEFNTNSLPIENTRGFWCQRAGAVSVFGCPVEVSTCACVHHAAHDSLTIAPRAAPASRTF